MRFGPYLPTRSLALRFGTLYFTGRPCKRGHASPRYAWGGCMECVGDANRSEDRREKARDWARVARAADPDKHRAAVARHRAGNRDAINARVAAWKALNRTHVAEYGAAYYLTHRSRLLDRRARYYASNKGREAAYHRRYMALNPLKNAERMHRRRALKLSAGGRFSAADVADIAKAQRSRCAYCRRRLKLTVDHITPLARGGRNDRQNIQLACRSCNSSKRDADPLDFARRLGRLI
jgi:5-methylcytosine-specific restriction endonuclease McrA